MFRSGDLTTGLAPTDARPPGVCGGDGGGGGQFV